MDQLSNQIAYESNRYSTGSGKIYGLKDAEYTYDSQNRLVKATGEGKTVTYSYNGDGLLYERTEGDQTTRYYYDEEAKLMAEAEVISGKAELTYVYIYDLYGKLWARQDKKTGKLEYYQFNGHGDVVGLVDDAGQVLDEYYELVESAKDPVYQFFKYLGQVKNSFRSAVNEIMRLQDQQAIIDNTKQKKVPTAKRHPF